MFKVTDYTTRLVGFRDDRGFYVERGDGTRYHYEFYRVVWSRKIA
ncbi:hypothetical protein [Ralstonia phage RP31]|uniref:Uncharacterized protein n=2 Tax=Ripduovirus RP12 TaxID=2560700 RepID=A0A1L7N0W3_9CAUD|nr:hypothetical protein FDH28_gp286 [Ralstonia phage RP12]BAW19109.1 hypothetical protein [Ralstonia phage RP12]BAW19395.1 hypothetical protein [Ralstonia phage RP31]